MWINTRLFGIDAPETAKKRFHKNGQPLGLAAKEFINNTLKGKDVLITQADLDPYNRPVVEIFLDGKSINLLMVEKGYAEVYRGKTKRIDRKKFEDGEKKAKEGKLGVWNQANYVSPSNFRRANK
jgi:endonuclease YncB( thermonuclease family)